MSVVDYANIQIDTLLLLAMEMPKEDKLRAAMLERADELIERVHTAEGEYNESP